MATSTEFRLAEFRYRAKEVLVFRMDWRYSKGSLNGCEQCISSFRIYLKAYDGALLLTAFITIEYAWHAHQINGHA